MTLPLHARAERRRRRRGNVAISGTLVITAVGIAALVVDVAYIEAEHARMQHITDAAAAAGAGHLDGTYEGMDAAVEAAQLVAAQHTWGGRTLELDANPDNDPDGEIVLGAYDEDVNRFVPSSDPELVNAVRVSRSGTLGTHFARILGHDQVTAHGGAAALAPMTGGASEVPCYLPFALPDCLWDDGVGPEQITLRLSPAGSDNAGWARYGAHPNASWIVAQLRDDCQDGELGVDDPIALNNGVISTALRELGQQIAMGDTTWDTEAFGPLPAQQARSAVPAGAYGRTVEGVIPIFEAGAEYCEGSGGRWNHASPVSGFVWVAVYDVVATGPARDKNLFLRIDSSREHDVGLRGNGPDHGVVARGDGRLYE